MASADVVFAGNFSKVQFGQHTTSEKYDKSPGPLGPLKKMARTYIGVFR